MPHPDEYLDPNEPIRLPSERATVDPMVSYTAGLLTHALWQAKDSNVLRVDEIESFHRGGTWETRLRLASGKKIRVTVAVEDE